MLLDDFCATLNRLPEWCGVQSVEYGVREERVKNSDYEVPEIREVESCAPLTPCVMLITAPASVGKSTAASYIGNVLRAPILDLSTLHVGDGTLEGALAKSLGIYKNAEFFVALSKGSATLIIDALDEAEVRSGQANFRAFIRGVADTASQIANGPAIILLSRAESARSLQEIFNERSLPYSHFEIRAFGKEQAKRYLDRRISNVFETQRKDAFHRKHPRPFEAARDELFALLASAVTQKNDGDPWQDPEVRDFLGYAPVLDVIGEYLAVDNFATLSKTIKGEANGSFLHWDLVASVIDDLLLREQRKFVQQFKETEQFQRLATARHEPVLYSPEEQCARLLGYIENLPIDSAMPAAIPEELRESYEAAVSTQLSNHPFIRNYGWFNVIFRDYVTSRSLISPLVSERATGEIRKNILSSEWKHSPMFGFFSYSLGKTSEGDASSCHSEEIGALYESFKSMCEAEDELVVTVGRRGNCLHATFAISRAAESEMVGPLEFISNEGTTSVSFPRELSQAHIWEVPEVILGGDHRSFKFGPGVYISCGDLLISSSEVQVYPGREGVPVVISTGSLASDCQKIQAEKPHLVVFCEEELPFPWSRYQRNVSVSEVASEAREASALYLEFRRIVLRFKDAKKGEGAVFQPMMDNLVVGTNRRARTVLNFLQEIGCVKIAKSMYLLDFAEFAKLGISRQQLRDLEANYATMLISSRLLSFSKKGQSES
ncbi:hypothetical protein ABZ569_14640 [Streptomyces albus]|uniref:hypothetical protein n=1 Tax=Streptomyces albus TaxID=1888 RepID=UPI0034078D3E